MSELREKANKEAVKRMIGAEPVLIDVQRAGDVIPGMRKDLILASGMPRGVLINGVLHEGLAATPEEAVAKLDAGAITVEPTQTHDTLGAGAGVITASMPVYVVENRTHGNRAYCPLVESNPPRVFVYGAWGDDVRERLAFVADVLGPLVGAAARRAGGIPLKPIMRRAIQMGDELHFRNEAGTINFLAVLAPLLIDLARERPDDVRRAITFIQQTPVMFMRAAAAAAKAALDAAHGVEGSSVLTAMVFSSKECALRVSGLGDTWFRGPLADFLGDYFWGSGPDDVAWSGGESSAMETMGLGGMIMANALVMPFGPAPLRIERNLRMYDITVAENAEYKIPYFDRGTPTGIDVVKVADTGIRPYIHGGVIRKDGNGAAGVGALECAIEPFRDAAAAWRARHGG